MTASPHTIKAAINIRNEIPLPIGYHVEVDDDTDNVLVIGLRFGFAVTGLFIRDHADYVTAVREQLENLKSAEETGAAVEPNYTVAQLAEQRTLSGWDK